MNRKKLTPYLLIGLALLLMVLAELLIPKPLNWTITLSADDKNPYGAYALYQVLPELFPPQGITHNHLTIYEMDTAPAQRNYLILAEHFAPDKADADVLLEKAAEGAHVFIAALHFRGSFADTLQLQTRHNLFESISQETYFDGTADSTFIRFTHPQLPQERFAYTLAALPASFDSLAAESEVLAQNQAQQAVFIRRPWGKGQLYLSTTPLAFSNYYLLEGNNHRFAETALSYLPPAPLYWTEFYQSGRLESSSPLRFVLSRDELRWAYYFGMIVLLLFVLFGLKRKQRPIPLMDAPQNTSLEFAGTIGQLYFQQGDHRNLALKKITYLNEYIRSHYRLQANWHDPSFVQQLALKSSNKEEKVFQLATQIHQVENHSQISADDLLQLNKIILMFYYSDEHNFNPTQESHSI
ncbi:DUF4350 domain-containing protein [Nafulsella turpanensis]|uniref:DUF4350 domain-containing protein n=1 Tax=Nafulsella turpanensis TaxID=1265690 RepID=UPI00034CAE32|nr:DUF4350 domain-containing protein [Nafulsella turpanensis]